MKQAITIETLKQYCRTHNIKIRSHATKAEIEAAIARAALHGIKIESGHCFGYWSSTDIECQYCASQDECFHWSLGLNQALSKENRETYLEEMDRMDRIRLVPMMKKKPKRKPRKK
jgi:hypothetical protein